MSGLKKDEVNQKGEKLIKLMTPEEMVNRLKLLNAGDEVLASLVYYFQQCDALQAQSHFFAMALTKLMVENDISSRDYTKLELNELSESLLKEGKDLFFEINGDTINLKIGSVAQEELKQGVK